MNCFVGTAALLLIGTPVLAGFIAEDIPDWRGDANTAWYEWESFTSASGNTGPNFPTNEAFPSGQALLFNFGEGAMISGEQNIYGFGGPLKSSCGWGYAGYSLARKFDYLILIMIKNILYKINMQGI